MRSPTVEVEIPAEEVQSDEDVNIDKALLVIQQLKDQGRNEEAAKLEALISKYDTLEQSAPPPATETAVSEEDKTPEAEEAELRQLIAVLRSQGQEAKALKAEKLIDDLKASNKAKIDALAAQDGKKAEL